MSRRRPRRHKPGAHAPPALVRGGVKAAPRRHDRGWRLDLHMHSTRSDGVLEVERLVAACAWNGLDFIAVTDHDIAPAVTAGTWSAGGRVVRVLEGVELSAVHQGQELHLLVYFGGPMPDDYRAFLHQRTVRRADRYDVAVANLHLDGLALADAQARDGQRAITRLHLAQAIVAAGHAGDVRGAMTRWTGAHTGMVPLVDLDWRQAIERSREAGGVTSWAHPPLDLAQRWAARFKDWGLQGLEASRPSLGRFGRAQVHRVAHHAGLFTTGGSDFHGWAGGAPGAYSFPLREARELLTALKVRPKTASQLAAGETQAR